MTKMDEKNQEKQQHESSSSAVEGDLPNDSESGKELGGYSPNSGRMTDRAF